MKHERIPPGGVALRRNTPIEARDGPVGHLRAIVLQPENDRVADVIVRRGALVATPGGDRSRCSDRPHRRGCCPSEILEGPNPYVACESARIRCPTQWHGFVATKRVESNVAFHPLCFARAAITSWRRFTRGIQGFRPGDSGFQAAPRAWPPDSTADRTRGCAKATRLARSGSAMGHPAGLWGHTTRTVRRPS